jgi:hypothetical protein
MPYDIDTHNPSVEASAARLLMLLEEIYAPLGSALDVGAQGSLIHYLKYKLGQEDMSEEEIGKLKDSPVLSETKRFIDYLDKFDEFSEEDKKRVYAQLLVIAGQYPGGNWNETIAHWSNNRFLNPKTGEEANRMTPPAVAINLVCCALLDKARYASEAGKEEEDLALRLRNAYVHLMRLRKEVEDGNLQKCAGGLQHDVVYWLNAGFLDKPKTEEGAKPVELLMGTPEFLKASLVDFIQKAIKGAYEEGLSESTGEMLERWCKAEDNGALISWLEERFNKGGQSWKDVCIKHMEERCKEFWVVPKYCDFSPYQNDGIDYICPTDVVDTPVLKRITGIWQLKEIALPSNYEEDSIYSLMAIRNKALLYFKRHDLAALNALPPEAIEEFYSLISLVDSLYQHRNVSFFMDGEHDAFFSVRHEMQEALLLVLRDYSFERRLSEEFESLKQKYVFLQQDFKLSEHTNFVNNFFAIQENLDILQWNATWSQLQSLNGSEDVSKHPFILSDEQLVGLRKKCASRLEDGSLVIDLTPYEINRLFLHGLLQPFGQWSEIYKNHLTDVVSWLLNAAKEGWHLQGFSKAYPKYFLSNMLMLSLLRGHVGAEIGVVIAQIEAEETSNKVWFFCRDLFSRIVLKSNTEQNRALWDAVKERIGILIQSDSQFLSILALPVEKFNAAQRKELWDAVKERIGILIQSGVEFWSILELPVENFNAEQRKELWDAVKERIGILVPSGVEFFSILELPVEKFNAAQRKELWDAVKEGIGILIPSGFQLWRLFKLPVWRLTVEHRTIILDALQGKLGELIQDYDLLERLFNLSVEELTVEHRTMVLSALKGNLGKIIQPNFELLRFLGLPVEKLTVEHRTMILDAIKDDLREIIQHFDQFQRLFKLPVEQLTVEHRTMILDALQGNLGELIQDYDQLELLFLLPVEQLTVEHRTIILAALQGKLGELIQDYGQLELLFLLPEDKLNAEQRKDLWDAVKNELGKKIGSGYKLYHLLILPEDKLNAEQKKELWDAVKNELDTIIIGEGTTVPILFSLTAQLNAEQKKELWDAVKGDLRTLLETIYNIRSSLVRLVEPLMAEKKTMDLDTLKKDLETVITTFDSFHFLLLLPVEQFTVEHRTMVLSALKGNLGKIIQNNFELLYLLELPANLLTVEHRTMILDALQGNLGTMFEECLFVRRLAQYIDKHAHRKKAETSSKVSFFKEAPEAEGEKQGVQAAKALFVYIFSADKQWDHAFDAALQQGELREIYLDLEKKHGLTLSDDNESFLCTQLSIRV